MAATATLMSAATLMKIIRENQLVDEAALTACLNSLPEDKRQVEEALPLADALVDQQLLSRFQANLLIQGKSRSLRITSKYRLLDRLGAGGMGLVYLCEHIRMKRLVALKVLPNVQAKEPGNLERFYREAQAVAALKHPNIVQAYDVDTDNGIHYLVMEFIDGINLDKLVTSHGPLDAVRAAHYIAQAADGLQHAADRNLVHRDIKPSNLLIDREGYIKVLDMGLARFFDSRSDNLTERFDNNAVIGTADFIAPEQALNSHDVDIRADIYSLGCTFYFLLTGKAPYHDANVTQKLLLHQVRDPIPLEQMVPGVDRALAGIVARMMAKKPDERYQSPGEVVADLSPWTAEPIDPPAEIPQRSSFTHPERTSGIASTLTNQAMSSARVSSRKQAPLPSRGTITEKVTLSAIRRMDGIPSDESMAGSRHRWMIMGMLLTIGVTGIIILAMGPWDRPVRIVKSIDDNVEEFDEKKLVMKPQEKGTLVVPPKEPAAAGGVLTIKLDARTVRPALLNGSLRAQPTDLLIFTGAELGSNNPADAPLVKALRQQQVAGIVPFAVGQSEGAKIPNTFIAVDAKSGIRPLRFAEPDVVITRDFVDLAAGSHVSLREASTLPPGTTTVNSLVAWPVDLRADEAGSTLKILSGAILLSSPGLTKSAGLGAGKSPLTLDFNGHTGYMTIASEQDYAKQPGGREYTIHARLVCFGGDALVISGTTGAVLRLDCPANACARLVLQGMQGTIRDKPFRVGFTNDAALGMVGGPVTINDAALSMMALTPAEVNRPLTLVRQGYLSAANVKGQLTWSGQISGDRLIAVGAGQMTLTHQGNDFNGLEVAGGTVLVQAGEGTPAGHGNVVVQTNGTLVGGGHLLKDLIIRGGLLQPGSDDGHSLVCDGKLTLERVPHKAPKSGEKPATLRFRLTGHKKPALVCTQGPAIDLGQAHLQLSFATGFVPTRETRCVLIDNRGGQRMLNYFVDAPQFGTVRTIDGRWTARISYTASAERGMPSGGFDVMLYDFVPANP